MYFYVIIKWLENVSYFHNIRGFLNFLSLRRLMRQGLSMNRYVRYTILFFLALSVVACGAGGSTSTTSSGTATTAAANVDLFWTSYNSPDSTNETGPVVETEMADPIAAAMIQPVS
jgi:hypothetical protein